MISVSSGKGDNKTHAVTMHARVDVVAGISVNDTPTRPNIL